MVQHSIRGIKFILFYSMLFVFPWLKLHRLLYLYQQQSRAGARWLSSHDMICDNCDIGAGHKAPPQPRRVKPHAVNSLWRPAFNLNQDKYTFTNTCTVHKAFYLNQDVHYSPWFVQQTAIGYSAKSCHQLALQQALPYNSSHRCDVMQSNASNYEIGLHRPFSLRPLSAILLPKLCLDLSNVTSQKMSVPIITVSTAVVIVTDDGFQIGRICRGI